VADDAPHIQRTEDGSSLEVRVTPKAGRDRVLGVRNHVLCVAVHAPPEKGKANQALLRFLAKILGVSRSSLDLLSGDTSRNKRIGIAGLEPREVARRLSARSP